MIKSVFFFVLRAAIGFLLIALILERIVSSGAFPAEAYETNLKTIYTWMFVASNLSWVAATLLALFVVVTQKGSETLRTAMSWAPIWLPPLYAALAYAWLSQMFSS